MHIGRKKVRLPYFKVRFLLSFINRYIKQHYLHQLNKTPDYEYLGHPINAYHLIRHVASDWNNVLNDMLHNSTWLQNNQKSIKRNNLLDDLGMFVGSKQIRLELFLHYKKPTKLFYIKKIKRYLNKMFVILEKLKRRDNERLPDIEDVNGAAFGIAKLWSQYR